MTWRITSPRSNGMRRGVGRASQRSDQGVWAGESGTTRHVSTDRPAGHLRRFDGDRLVSARGNRSSGARYVWVDDARVRENHVPPQAKKTVRGEQLQQQMKQRGILVKAVSMSGLAEEAGLAYKNISEVVNPSIVRESQKRWWNCVRSGI
jgi:Uncharacterized conserved protein